MKEIEGKLEIDEEVEAELSNRFKLIAVESTDGTANMPDAAPELYAFCR